VIFANRFWEKCKMDLLNVQRLANDLGVNTIYNLTRNRGQADAAPIPRIRIGRRLFFRRESVERWITERETTR
jgi:hypothetical protein